MLHRVVTAMVYVEPQAANRFVARTRADTYEKFWGYPMLVVAAEDEAAAIAVRLLAGEAASDIVVDDPHVAGVAEMSLGSQDKRTVPDPDAWRQAISRARSDHRTDFDRYELAGLDYKLAELRNVTAHSGCIVAIKPHIA